MKHLLVLVIMVAATGCATNFVGSAYVEEGRAGCERKCQGDGLEMSGMVYMGEYSSACVCEVPGAAGTSTAQAGGSTTGAAAGVVMQMRRNEENERNNNSNSLFN